MPPPFFTRHIPRGKAGYIFTPDRNNNREYFAGVTLSPYKSYRGYLQAELMVSAASFDQKKVYGRNCKYQWIY